MIDCRSVSKSYRGRPAVNAIDLTIRGGICGLLGANGAGKSTLLKLMCGLLVADSGTIAVDGLALPRRRAAVQQIMGVVPEELGLFESLTVLENLEAVGPIYGVSAGETRLRAEQMLRRFDLIAGRDRFAGECSFGMRKKTALAMALLHSPKVLILDEPFEGVDPSSSKVIQETLMTAAGRGVTVVLTSHNLRLIEALASRIVMLKDGAIAWDSEKRQASEDLALEEIYFDVVGRQASEELTWLGS